MLTMGDYNALDDTEKSRYDSERRISHRREKNGLMVQLYNVHKFYGELYYDPLANKIHRCRAFEGIQQDLTWRIFVLIRDN